MTLRLLICAAALLFSACGAQAAAPPKPTPLPTAGSLRVVKAPIVVFYEQDGYVLVHWRFNRPLRASDTSDELGFPSMTLDSLGSDLDDEIEADVSRPTCYWSFVEVGDAPVGQQTGVKINLAPGRTLQLTGTIVREEDHPHPEQELGCPRDPEGHSCGGTIRARHLTIRLGSAYGTSCATARRVFGRFGTWVNPEHCKWRLCVQRHRMNAGFRCDAWFDNGGEGFPAWTIECHKGRSKVTAYADQSYIKDPIE